MQDIASKIHRLLQGLLGLLVLGFSAATWGYCVSTTDTDTIINAAGTQTCESIDGMSYGCRIDKGVGTCDALDAGGNVIFTVESTHSTDLGLSWTATAATADYEIDMKATTINGARGGNSCVFIYSDPDEPGYGTHAGAGQGDYDDNKLNYANVQFAEFCTDVLPVDPAEPPTLQSCDSISSELDGTGIDCSTLDPSSQRFLISLDPNKDNWSEGGVACTCNVTFTECDEGATAQGGTCIGDNPLKALPVVWEAGNDGTWVCRTINGERQCWSK